MKKKILLIAMALALIAVLAAPLTASAETTVVSGSFDASSTFTQPGGVSLTLAVGDVTGNSSTPGSIDTNTSGWTLSVADAKTYNNGYMTVGGTDSAGAVKLGSAIQVGTTAVTVGTIAAYQTALQAQAGYGVPTSTYSIPLYVKQTVSETDQAGSYSITLTYTFTPGT